MERACKTGLIIPKRSINLAVALEFPEIGRRRSETEAALRIRTNNDIMELQKNAAGRRKIMAKKYYAVRAGRSPGIYENWDDCKKQVMGFSGAIYKSFPVRADAEAFVQAGTAEIGGADAKTGCKAGDDDRPADEAFEGGATAYVDGSYDHRQKKYSCGAILFFDGAEKEFSKQYSNPEMAEMRNVAGEIMGAAEVIAYCLENKIPALTIYHDYEGVARWADGSWKANKKGTQEYAAYCKNASKTLKLKFCKVKGHSGDKYNDMADALAKAALGIL